MRLLSPFSCLFLALFAVGLRAQNPSTPVITSATTVTASLGFPFNYQITASPAATSYTVTGLPGGLFADANTGLISGTPLITGEYPINITGSNANGAGAVSVVTLTIGAPSLIVGSSSVFGTVNSSFRYVILASNSPTLYSATGLPAGLNLDTTSGVITGRPTVTGSFNVTLRALNPIGGGLPFNLTIVIGTVPVITSAPSVITAINRSFAYQITTTGTPTGYTASNLPPGLTLNAATGVISGTPTDVGTTNVTLQAFNAAGSSTAFNLSLTFGAIPVITSSSGANGAVGSVFNYTITASNSASNFVVYGLPDGLVLNGGTGVITGTPSAGGRWNVSLYASNGYGTSAALNLVVNISGGTPPVPDPNRSIFLDTPPIVSESPTDQTVVEGSNVTLTVATPGGITGQQWLKNNLPIGGGNGLTLTLANVKLSDAGEYSIRLTNSWGTTTSSAAILTVTPAPRPPVILTQPASQQCAPGATASFGVTATSDNAFTYQWYFNDQAIAGATASSYVVASVDPTVVGQYTVRITSSSGTTTSNAAILGLLADRKLNGTGSEVGTDLVHPNGNIYDQVQVWGSSVTAKADPGQVLRLSFIDLTDDIVQVEFAGSGTIVITLDNATGPATPVKYNQNIQYMKGHARIVISDADETTNVSVFSVGSATAINQALFKTGVAYDGFADLASITIVSRNGKFGGVRAANASFYATTGSTGVYAPDITFTGPVYIGDIAASDSSTPVIRLGSSSDVRITGGDLLQPNGRAVQVSGIARLNFTAGLTSFGALTAAQQNRARLEESGVDVTNDIVVNP